MWPIDGSSCDQNISIGALMRKRRKTTNTNLIRPWLSPGVTMNTNEYCYTENDKKHRNEETNLVKIKRPCFALA